MQKHMAEQMYMQTDLCTSVSAGQQKILKFSQHFLRLLRPEDRVLRAVYIYRERKRDPELCRIGVSSERYPFQTLKWVP